jgi:NAD+ synthase (glutamine-hydrolysing)
MLEAPRWRAGIAATTVDLDRTTRLRAENTTWRTDAADYLAAHPRVATIDVPATVFSTAAGRAALTYPVPASGSFFLPDVTPPPSPRALFYEDILDALALGVGDYFEKNPGFKKLGVALSGGRDSLLTLLVAHRYAGRVRPDDPGSLLQAFYMPSRFSSEQTRRAAEMICRELGVPLEIVPIDDAYERELAATEAMLAPGESVTEITKQNIQARIRGQRMWNWSNSSGGLFLQTGNMSEKAVGYTTVGGDLEGALAVLANVPKTVVMALLDYLHQQTGYEGIALVLARPAGPELAPEQEGEQELMPFPVLDACFHLFAAEKLLPQEVEEALLAMFPAYTRDQLRVWVEKFTRLFLGSIYKWVQAPISLHIGTLDLDRERALQLPVVQNKEWAAIEAPEPALRQGIRVPLH